jgi:hypothetical protein
VHSRNSPPLHSAVYGVVQLPTHKFRSHGDTVYFLSLTNLLVHKTKPLRQVLTVRPVQMFHKSIFPQTTIRMKMQSSLEAKSVGVLTVNPCPLRPRLAFRASKPTVVGRRHLHAHKRSQSILAAKAPAALSQKTHRRTKSSTTLVVNPVPVFFDFAALLSPSDYNDVVSPLTRKVHHLERCNLAPRKATTTLLARPSKISDDEASLDSVGENLAPLFESEVCIHEKCETPKPTSYRSLSSPPPVKRKTAAIFLDTSFTLASNLFLPDAF